MPTEYRYESTYAGGHKYVSVACCERFYKALWDVIQSRNAGVYGLTIRETSGCESCGPSTEDYGDPINFCPWCGQPPYIRQEEVAAND